VSSPITLEDVLNIKYLGKWDWSPDGRYIAHISDDGGLHDLWLVEPGAGQPSKVTCAKRRVSDFGWSPDGDLYFVQDGNLFRLEEPGKVLRTSAAPDPAFGQPSGPALHPALQLLFESKSAVSGLSWSPDGSLLAFARDSRVWMFSKADGRFTELSLPGKAAPAGEESGAVLWAPSSRKFAFSFRDEETYRQIGVAKPDGTVIWRSYFAGSAGALSWFDEDTLYFARPGASGTSADLYTLVLSGDKTEVTLLRRIEGNGRGPVFFTGALPSPDRTKSLLLLEDDGYAHYYVLDRSDGGIKQVTFGKCEDFAHASDTARWLPDSRSFLYASNRDSAGERHIFRHDLDTGKLDTGKDEKIVGLPGTNSMVKVSPDGRIGFQHCDEFRNMDIWVAGPNGERPAQVTFSMPPAWTPENQFAPEEISFESAGGLAIHGYLMKPKDVPAGKRLPGLVWVHGGPVRQMRPGWNPLRSYALFHGFNQYLIHHGYVVLSVNYRGGIGYGRDFRQALYHKMGVDDVADVVGAGNYLKDLPYVDAGRVAIWGLSYGGYMTMHSLTQYPDVFKCGVNIAGIWDYPQWTRWADKRYGKGTGSFKVYLGGEPEGSPELYMQGSPRTFAKKMKAPLLNVQGMLDMNVDFQQMDRIIEDLVDLGKEFEVIYYPNEVHTFAKRKTWLDAMPKIQAFLDKHLKG